jgi:predicted kinase
MTRHGPPTAFLLHGFLGTGKTTLARRLETEEQALRFTHDEWMRSLYGIDPPEAQFADYALRVSRLMENTWLRCLALGTNVVLDFGFWARSERDHVCALVAAAGAKTGLYQLSCPDEVAWERIEKRNRRGEDNLFIAANTYRVLKARFEPLEPDEARIALETAHLHSG